MSQSSSPPEVVVTTTAATTATKSSRSVSHVLDVGKLQIDSARSAYVSSPHWSAVLNGLSELRSLWPAAEDGDCDGDEFFPGDQTNNQYYKAEPSDSESPMSLPSEAPLDRRRFQLLFGGHRLMTLDEILQAMPPRAELVTHIATKPQYEKFWKAPRETPILWIAMLFGVISVASQSEAAWARFAPGGPVPMTQQPLPLPSPFPLLTPPFVIEIAACLILGEYTKGGAYALEALLHYQFIEVTSSPDLHADAWLLSGVITRLAFRMGYHRDPSHFPSLSPFEGEARRRIWVIVHCHDTMMSAQMGLPRLVKASSWDTHPPRNLLDSDFDQDCVELPAERPPTESTPALHLLAKHKMFIVIARITDMNMSVVGPDSPPRSLVREKEMTKALFDAHDSLPDKCKFYSMLGCIAESAADIMGRISSSALLQKGLIAIHWRRLMASDAQEEAEQLQHWRTCGQARC
ncbi:hypothetical protein NQ176_g3849 [Zarea fungicola]|uniref:Uncharacterized protein n=1 Tax=Zarea fungicola TaxID=93591 RepID=A0ACC1NH41_9HYPO|nr:hypothetical protein NQ176_g3849 [Lecanicillium fungicola]